MGTYIVNGSIKGYESKQLGDTELTLGSDSLTVVIVDSNTHGKLKEYYTGILDILVSKNKVALVLVGEDSSITKPLCYLMCSYRSYNIYKIESLDTLDGEYIESIRGRESSYDEVQTFLGGDMTAYSDINTILMGIENLVSDGNIEGLKVFLEQHMPTVTSMTEVIDYMKTVVDTSNSGELIERVEKLSLELKNKTVAYEQTVSNVKEVTESNNKLEVSLSEQQKELQSALALLDGLKRQDESDGKVIRSYTELNTSMIKCKAKIIIYFKEISQIPYINSMILAFLESIKLRGLRAKLMIYDTSSGLYSVYKPLNVVGSTEYMSKRDTFASKTEQLVIVEPNPIIIDDVLTHSLNPYDVVIIYDRMKQVNDIVVGNNVHKFHIINSKKDFNEVKGILKISDTSTVITRSDSNISKEVLDIPVINDYSSSTTTAKISKYMKAVTKISGKPLIKTISSKVRIESITK